MDRTGNVDGPYRKLMRLNASESSENAATRSTLFDVILEMPKLGDLKVHGRSS